MRDVLFVQGAGEGVHAAWDSHLVASLRAELGPQYDVRYPRMPNEADPTVATWGPVIERQLAALSPGAVVVGHSVGGTMLVQVLAHAARVPDLGAVALIAAPFIGPGGWPSDEVEPTADLTARLPATVPVFVYHGEDDAVVPVAHAARYAEALPRARVRRLAGRDHQLNGQLGEVAHDIRMLERKARQTNR
jgi:predicted alpha/beta hydrolase family esterase